jgi:hypothetical protein
VDVIVTLGATGVKVADTPGAGVAVTTITQGVWVGGTGVAVTTTTTGVAGPSTLLRSQANSVAATSRTTATKGIRLFVFIFASIGRIITAILDSVNDLLLDVQ